MFANVNKKRVVGHVVDDCSRCGDNLPLEKFRNEWLCSDCLKVFKRSLAAPRDIRESERQKERFHEMADS